MCKEFLIKTFKKLDIELLKEGSRDMGIGCPFHNIFKGPVYHITLQVYCLKLCGVIYPKTREYLSRGEVTCPCFVYSSKSYVKKVFWKEFSKIRGAR